jgi:hypothetical protein
MACFLCALPVLWAEAQNAPGAASSPASASHLPAPKPTASDIAAAKASHKVWVNLDTGIYHRAGRWYGKTKSGKFMTLDDAKKAGYKRAKRD